MATIRRPVTRRKLLKGAGAAALAVPFVSSLVSESVRAAEGLSSKRLVVFFTPNEPIDRAHWLPQTNGTTLTGLAPMMAALEPHRDRLLLLGDLAMKTRDVESFAGGHVGTGHLLTGRTVNPYGTGQSEFWASGISVDQHIADALGVEALTLAARPGGSNGVARISYRGPNQPAHPITRPDQAFASLFADAALPPDEFALLRARRLSILDRVAGDLQGLHSRLAAEARGKLEVHLELIRDLEHKFANDVQTTCDPIEVPGGVDYEANANFPTAARRHIDVLVQALACGLADVASLQLGSGGAGHVTPLWPDEDLSISLDLHTIAHNYNQGSSGATLTQRQDVETFFFRLFAYLLDQLAMIREGDGSVLDNTLVLWAKHLGRNHASEEMLFILAGGAGGALQTGRFLSFPGTSHNDLLVSVCGLMGLPDTSSFGMPSLCTGPLSL